MLVVEGTYENGEFHLDIPVAYQQPVRVRVEFLDELSTAVRPPAVRSPTERMQRLQASWNAARQLSSVMTGSSLSDEVLAARQEEPL